MLTISDVSSVFIDIECIENGHVDIYILTISFMWIFHFAHSILHIVFAIDVIMETIQLTHH